MTIYETDSVWSATLDGGTLRVLIGPDGNLVHFEVGSVGGGLAAYVVDWEQVSAMVDWLQDRLNDGAPGREDLGGVALPGRPQTAAARYIGLQVLPDWWRLFVHKNAEYGDDHSETGLLGQVFDIIRKTNKIKRALWRGKPLTTEQPREVLLDLAGHCFLAVQLMDEEAEEAGTNEFLQTLEEDHPPRPMPSVADEVAQRVERVLLKRPGDENAQYYCVVCGKQGTEEQVAIITSAGRFCIDCKTLRSRKSRVLPLPVEPELHGDL